MPGLRRAAQAIPRFRALLRRRRHAGYRYSVPVVQIGAASDPSTTPAAAFDDKRALYLFTAHRALYWSESIKTLRAHKGTAPGVLPNASNYFAVERDREGHIIVHNIHSNAMRTGVDVSANNREKMLSSLGINPHDIVVPTTPAKPSAPAEPLSQTETMDFGEPGPRGPVGPAGEVVIIDPLAVLAKNDPNVYAGYFIGPHGDQFLFQWDFAKRQFNVTTNDLDWELYTFDCPADLSNLLDRPAKFEAGFDLIGRVEKRLILEQSEGFWVLSCILACFDKQRYLDEKRGVQQ